MNQKTIKITAYLGVFLVVTGISYFAFDKLIPVSSSKNTTPVGDNQQNKDGKKTGSIEFSGPKTEVCPINGALFTSKEKEAWSQRRPLLVMIENHEDSRPQSGLDNADIVYEAVAEGGITRFMGVFYCGAVKGSENKYDVGPVRSARTYFLDLASEYSDYPLYNHVGGANCSAPKDPVTGRQSGPCTTNKKAQAIEQIADYGWNNQGTWGDLSEFSLSYKVCRREPDRTGEERATEHTMYCSTKELWNTASQRGLTDVTKAKSNSSWDKNYRSWSFKQNDKASSNITAANITMDFWSGYKAYAVNWKYDKENNKYLRFNGGQPHVDFNTNTQLSAKNVVVQYVKETRSIDEHMHNLYAVVGNGTGVLFQNGEATEITWSKVNRTSRTIFKDSSGKEINFVPGQTWIELLPTSSKVNYEAAI
jgi:hypothetical protein